MISGVFISTLVRLVWSRAKAEGWNDCNWKGEGKAELAWLYFPTVPMLPSFYTFPLYVEIVLWLLKTLFFLSYSGFHVFWKNWKRGPKSRSMAVVSWDSSSDLRTSFWWILSKRTHMPFLLYWKNCVDEPIMPVSPVVQLCFRIIVNFLCFCHVFVFIHPSSVHCELCMNVYT